MSQNEGVTPSGPGHQPSASAPICVGSSQSGVPNAADFTIADVLAWARTKPVGEAYIYTDNQNCALCQFLRETGRAKEPNVYSDATWHDGESGPENHYLPELDEAAGDFDDMGFCRTFGGLVRRLEALCPETPVTQSNWSAIDAYLLDIECLSA